MSDARPIGVFDSGVGGVSVLRDLVRLLPRERFIYYGDNKNAPYGTRREEEIRALSLDVANWLLSRDVKAMLVVEFNAGQMIEDVRQAVYNSQSAQVPNLRIEHFGPLGSGVILSPDEVVDAAKRCLNNI